MPVFEEDFIECFSTSVYPPVFFKFPLGARALGKDEKLDQTAAYILVGERHLYITVTT